MSKIAKEKALEEYPTPLDNEPFISKGFIDEKRREGYIVGYDQSMKDFIEKACEWWSTMPDDTYGFNPCKIYVEQFKNYMQDESEN